jgi:hypothetical protein
LAQSGQTALRGRSLVSYELDETVLLWSVAAVETTTRTHSNNARA